MTDAAEARDKRWIALILLCSAQFVLVLVLVAIANSEIGTSTDPATLTDGFASAFLVGAGFAVVGLIATLLLIRSADSKAHVELGAEPVTESSS